MKTKHPKNIQKGYGFRLLWILLSPVFTVVTLAAIVAGFSAAPLQAAQAPSPTDNDDIEILASGPIHEAFAQAVTLDPEPGPLVAQQPPQLIEEIPPDQKPEGDVQWIPGYWAWDDDRNDFIWVSGIWRVPPPDRQWIPGYWNSTANGYQWISGYWASDKTSRTAYLPEPPESVEIGPSSNAPSPDHTWIPGAWVWHNGRYAWRAGYWAPVQPDWVWVPGHYVWAPRGYIYVSGYWDFIVAHRGVLFAPIFFPTHVSIGWVFPFSPRFIVQLSIFDDALFLRPTYHHYYFGDYYAHRHYQRGIYPWFSLHARRVVYDPIYAHQRWDHRNDGRWVSRLETEFRKRRDNEALRPPQRFDTHSRPVRTTRSEPQRPTFIAPLNQTPSAPGRGFTPLSETERKNFIQREKEVVRYSTDRQRRETIKDPKPDKGRVENRRPSVEKMPPSPIKSKPGRNERIQQQPSRQREPVPNPNVEPLERKSRTPSARTINPGKDNRRVADESRKQPAPNRSTEAENSVRGRNGSGQKNEYTWPPISQTPQRPWNSR